MNMGAFFALKYLSGLYWYSENCLLALELHIANTYACSTDSMPGPRPAERHPQRGRGGQQSRGAVAGADGGGGGGPGGGWGWHDRVPGEGPGVDQLLIRCPPWSGREVGLWEASSEPPMTLRLSSLM